MASEAVQPNQKAAHVNSRMIAWLSVVLVAISYCGAVPSAWAQSPDGPAARADPTATPATGPSDPATTTDAARRESLWGVIFSGGPIGVLIVLVLVVLSVASLALAIEHLMTIRQSVLMPPGLADEVRNQLTAGKLAAADAACRQQPSFLSFVLRAALAETEGGWPAVEKALEDATAEQAARLFRKIEYLSVIGNIAPMIGLLGTVIGMIFAFQEVAESQGAARAAQLAEGIYTALVTTVGGLLVAIPSLALFAVFRNRVDQLVAEASYAALHALSPLKRRTAPTTTAPTTTAPTTTAPTTTAPTTTAPTTTAPTTTGPTTAAPVPPPVKGSR